MNIEYGKIFTNAWNITWKHKILWFFAFLILLVSGNGGFSGSANFDVNRGQFRTGTYTLPPELQNLADQINQIDLSQVWGYIAIAVACLIILWIVFFALSIIGQGGLIGGILQADSTGSLKFREAWALGRKYFWRLLLVAVIEFFIVLAAVVLIAITGVVSGVLPFFLCCFVPLCCAAVLLLIAFSFYMYLVRISVVADDTGLGTAFGNAWTVLKDKIGPFIIIGVLLFAVSLVVGFATLILALPAVIAFLGAFWPWIQNTGSLNLTVLYLALFFLVVFLVLSWIIRSVLGTWIYAVYTLVYRQFSKPQTKPAPSPVQPTI